MTNAYANTYMTSDQVTSLMRRINVLEASVSSGGTESFSFSFGEYGAGNGEFFTPYDAVVYNSELFIVDVNRVQVFDLDGTYKRQFSSGYPIGPLMSGIATHNGNIYVVTLSRYSVTGYDINGVIQSEFGGYGTANGKFTAPARIAVYNNEIYVSEGALQTGPHRIQVFDSSGVFQRAFGSLGTGDGQFNFPRGMCGYNNELYVADALNNRIQVFNTNGLFFRKWGTSGSGNGEFDRPFDVAEYGGLIYVTDFGNDRIQVFNTAGTYQRQFTVSTLGFPLGLLSHIQRLYVCGSAVVTNAAINVFLTPSVGVPQTEFYSYTQSAQTSLGTPDGGVSIPDLNALDTNEADHIWKHITDMRTAVQALAPNFTNALTGNPFNWTDSSADNLYFVAMGDRTDYHPTIGAGYDWERPAFPSDTFAYDIDIGEIDACLTLLEAS